MTVSFPGKASDFLKIGVAAAGRGDIESVRGILKSRPHWLEHVGSHGRTMLWEAAHRGKLVMVKYLVKRGADINACGTHYTPYFVEVSCYCIARYRGHDAVADYLLKKGANLNIHTAAFLGDLTAVKRYLRRSVKRLSEGHPQYEMIRKDTRKAKHNAAQGTNATYADFVIAPAPWATPLCYALRGADHEMVQYLIEKGSPVCGNEQALFIAANKDAEKIRMLLAAGADPALAPDFYADEQPLAELMSQYGQQAADNAGEQLVYLCRGDRGGNPSEVVRWLQRGADVNHQDSRGKTALHRAAKAGLLATMKVLLKHGARVDIEDPAGETAIFEVARSTIKSLDNRLSAIKLLRGAGADLKHRNQKGQTPLVIAQRKDDESSRAVARRLRR